VIRNMAANGIKVELYKTSGRHLTTFYVGGQVGSNAGSYMLMEGAERPYVVQIPGFEGYLTPRYSTTFSDWRDRTVFRVPREDVRTVTVFYSDSSLNNYTVTQDDKGKVSVSINPAIMSDANKLNERRATVYTKFFENVNCEGYLNGAPHLDSVIAHAPKRCTIEVTDKTGKKQRAEVYWMWQGKRSKNLDTPDPDIPAGFDSDRFYATINNNKDTVVIQRVSFDKIIRRGFEFYQPDEQPSAPDSLLKNRTFRAPK
jgi:hypothetical protein